MVISIHAPTRGATARRWRKRVYHEFQSTLPREERPCALFCTFRQCSYFNPRSHERSDHICICIHQFCLQFQSTLPREERQIIPTIMCTIAYFNPRSHERSDHATASGRCAYMNFNPRSHERSDNNSTDLTKQLTYFNPRSHERSDADVDNRASYSKISIHAPTRGATLSAQNPHIYSLLFQSTLPREERRF